MKRILLLFSLILPLFTVSQITCVLSPSDTLMCARDSMAFVATVQGSGPTTFQWLKNGTVIPDAVNDTLAFPHVMDSDTGIYHCIATRGVEVDTSNSAHLRVHSVMNIWELRRFNELGCRLYYDYIRKQYFPNCNAQFVVGVAGGDRPLAYYWGGGFMQDSLVLGLCPNRNYTVRITDNNGCEVDSTFFVDYLKTPDVPFVKYQLSYDLPRETFYITNPNVTVEFPKEYFDTLYSWVWRFGDGDSVQNLNPVTHTYRETGSYLITLKVTDLNDCDTTFQDSVTIKKPILKIPSAFTPDDDEQQKNETFMIKILIKDDDPASFDYDDKDYAFENAYLGNELIVLDRAGSKVYNAVNYKSGDWDGGKLPDGVYFYVLKCQGQYEDEAYRGAIHIMGKGF